MLDDLSREMATPEQEVDQLPPTQQEINVLPPANMLDGNDSDTREISNQEPVMRTEDAMDYLSFPIIQYEKKKTMVDVTTQTEAVSKFQAIINFERLNAKQILYFTEFSHDQFNALYNFLAKSKCMSSELLSKYKFICPMNQLLMTLYKYRLNQDFKMIGAMFNVTPPLVCKIFKHWSKIINICLSDIDFWSLGKTDGTKYRVCLHCVKVFFDSILPVDSDFRKKIHRAHYRCLIGINEGGIVIFCSKLFSCDVSLRQMFDSSNLLDGLKKGDEILTSSDFRISDLLQERGVTVDTAPFIHNSDSIPSTASATVQILGRKIHTDRLATLVSTYKILAEPVENESQSIGSEIIYNCAMLCNFRPKKQ
nr:PREDICTED: uncharacterized protein LOC109040999 [Bemisia tabaci]